MKKVVTIIFVSLIFSCQSANYLQLPSRSDLLGVVFDRSNNPIQSGVVSFYLEDELVAQSTTDINGRFIVQGIQFALYKVVLSSEVTAPIDINFTHESSSNILIIRAESINDLTKSLESSIKNRDLKASKIIIDKLNAFNINNPYTKFLEAIYLYKSQRYNESKLVLNNIDIIESEYTKQLIEMIEVKLND